jgi:rSAM/selenodomain-associated transferase 1
VAYVVAKAPRPGVTKTRLCPPLAPEQAAQLARAFLLDTLTNVMMAGLSPRIVCRGPTEQRALRRLAGPFVRVSIQVGQGLGDALEGAFREGLADGFGAVAVLAADSPTLPTSVLRDAFVALADGSDVVLGPVDDGGYYTLAARAVHPSLFRDMPWSTGEVASETLRRSRALGLRANVLPAWYDVDDDTSLAALYRELRALPGTFAPRTRAVLQAMHLSLPLGTAA